MLQGHSLRCSREREQGDCLKLGQVDFSIHFRFPELKRGGRPSKIEISALIRPSMLYLVPLRENQRCSIKAYIFTTSVTIGK